MDLPTIWFVAVAFLWTGYLVLEGFDFGVGMLLSAVSRNDADRRAVVNTIGPVWDGNEVWLITAVGVMFAAFPGWYASALSGMYPLLLVVLVTLIPRGVAFEFRGKVGRRRWTRVWDAAILLGSAVPAFGWGVLFANLLRGLPMDAAHVVRAPLTELFDPYALLGGLLTLSLFVLHGGVFLTLKTGGALRPRCRRAAMLAGAVAVPVQAGFGVWTWTLRGGAGTLAASVVLVLLTVLGVSLAYLGRVAWSFLGTAAATVAYAVLVFATMWPTLLPSTTNPAFGLTVQGSAASAYALTLLSWSCIVLVPLVLGYQAWTYRVFSRRLRRPAAATAR